MVVIGNNNRCRCYYHLIVKSEIRIVAHLRSGLPIKAMRCLFVTANESETGNKWGRKRFCQG